MIYIRCTEKEKEDLIRVFDYSESCLFEGINEVVCRPSDMNCHQCIDDNIEWDIIEENK